MRKIIYILILATYFLYGCPDWGYDEEDFEEYLNIINNSDDTVFYLTPSYLYKDEKEFVKRLLIDSIEILENERWLILPQNQKTMLRDNTIFDRYGNRYSFSVIFFGDSIVRNTSWSTIVNDSIYLKRCDFHSWKELEATGFKVAYP